MKETKCECTFESPRCPVGEELDQAIEAANEAFLHGPLADMTANHDRFCELVREMGAHVDRFSIHGQQGQ